MFPEGQQSEREEYLSYLPAIFRRGAEGEALGKFLTGFEQVLSGRGTVKLDPEGDFVSHPEEGRVVGLEEILDGTREGMDGEALAGVHRYFDPGPERPNSQRAPARFLNWLAGWVALSLRADLEEPQWRELIDRAAYLYRWRGTKRSLRQLINIYTDQVVDIHEEHSFQIERRSTIESDTFIEGRPHFFRVDAQLDVDGAEEEARHRHIIRAIVEMEKPAHTQYELDITGTVRMQIETHSTIGKDTILGA